MIKWLKKLHIFHSWKETYDSEKELWKNGRRPPRISVGGYTKYKCEVCGKEYTKSWSCGAF